MWRHIAHWITRSIHENSKLRTCWEHVVYTNCFFVFVLTFRTIYAHNMFSQCSELVVFMYWIGKSMNNLFVILWVSWFKNKCFWKKSTCTIDASKKGGNFFILVWWADTESDSKFSLESNICFSFFRSLSSTTPDKSATDTLQSWIATLLILLANSTRSRRRSIVVPER